MNKLMHIVLCEDDLFFLKFLEDQIRKSLDGKEFQKKIPRNIQFQIHSFQSGESLLKSNLESIDLIFLDINLQGISGIEVARTLQKRKYNSILIFVSGYIKYAPVGYEVKAFRYLLKSQLKLTFAKTMYDSLQALGCFTTELTFSHKTENISFFWSQVTYVESHLHYMHFHFAEEDGVIYINSNQNGTLNDLEHKLPEDTFIRIHQSYLVNIRFIKDIKDYSAYLNDGEILSTSQNKFPEAKRKFYLYKGGQ